MRFAWVAVLIWMVSAGAAHAQEPALTWQAPEACGSPALWLASLRARVDAAAWRDAMPKLRVTVRIEPITTGYALQLDTELDGAVGQRRMEAARCEELVEASVLIVALALDPSASERAVGAAPVFAPVGAPPAVVPAQADVSTPAEPEARPEPPAPEPPKETRAAAEPPPPAQRWDSEDAPEPSAGRSSDSQPRRYLFVRPLMLVDGGTLPDVALGPALQVGVRIARWSVELGVGYLLAQSIEAPASSRVVGDLRWLAGTVGACFELTGGRRFQVAPCARLELGRIWGQGRNLEEDMFSGGATWLAFVPGLLAALEVVGGLSTTLELGLGVPVLPSAFTVGGIGEVHASPAVAGRLAAGFSLRF